MNILVNLLLFDMMIAIISEINTAQTPGQPYIFYIDIAESKTVPQHMSMSRNP